MHVCVWKHKPSYSDHLCTHGRLKKIEVMSGLKRTISLNCVQGSYCGKVIGEFPLLVPLADIGTMQGAELGAVLLSGLMQGREVPTVSGIDQAVVLDQHPHAVCQEIHITTICSIYWRRESSKRVQSGPQASKVYQQTGIKAIML